MVHGYKLNGYNIIVDGNSGSIHSVDEVAFDAIMKLEKGEPREAVKADIVLAYGIDDQEATELFDDIDELISQKKLFSDDPFEGVAHLFKMRQSVLKAICLHVAHDCNMDCEYCFAGKGQYHGDRGLMSFETGKRALDYLVENSPGRRNLEVDFFGGEPLLNWEVCKQLVEYGRSIEEEKGKNFRFTLTTNGLLLNDEITEYLNKEMGNVVISLDGRKEVNDKKRHNKAGGGTYDLIVEKFQRLAKSRSENALEYYMRGTYTSDNTDFSEDLKHMADLGFTELSIEPVVAPSSASYALSEKDLPKLCEEYEKLALEMIKRRDEGRPFTFYHYMVDLTGGPCISKRISGCGVGTEYLAITPEGDIYPCHQFVGDEKYKLGDVWNGIAKQEIKDDFCSVNVYSHDECKACWARVYCSGGCAANAVHTTGKVNGVYQLGCELHRKRMECAIMLKVDEYEKESGN